MFLGYPCCHHSHDLWLPYGVGSLLNVSGFPSNFYFCLLPLLFAIVLRSSSSTCLYRVVALLVRIHPVHFLLQSILLPNNYPNDAILGFFSISTTVNRQHSPFPLSLSLSYFNQSLFPINISIRFNGTPHSLLSRQRKRRLRPVAQPNAPPTSRPRHHHPPHLQHPRSPRNRSLLDYLASNKYTPQTADHLHAFRHQTTPQQWQGSDTPPERNHGPAA